MRLLVYLNLRRNEFVTQYFQDRQKMYELLSFNCYGNLVIQYIFIEDNKVFYRYEDYKKYCDKKYKIKKNYKYDIGQAIIKLGMRICFGKQEKVKIVYKYKYPWWK